VLITVFVRAISFSLRSEPAVGSIGPRKTVAWCFATMLPRFFSDWIASRPDVRVRSALQRRHLDPAITAHTKRATEAGDPDEMRDTLIEFEKMK
jgi:hypothetical protein